MELKQREEALQVRELCRAGHFDAEAKEKKLQEQVLKDQKGETQPPSASEALLAKERELLDFKDRQGGKLSTTKVLSHERWACGDVCGRKGLRGTADTFAGGQTAGLNALKNTWPWQRLRELPWKGLAWGRRLRAKRLAGDCEHICGRANGRLECR
eukprot:s1301_g7.t1